MVPVIVLNVSEHQALSVLALSSRFDGPDVNLPISTEELAFSTRSVESF